MLSLPRSGVEAVLTKVLAVAELVTSNESSLKRTKKSFRRKTMIRECNECGDEYDTASAAKRASGGLFIHCPSCSEEHAVKYAGVQAADGKQAQATILKFESERDKVAYIRFWKNNSGFNKGKSCQLGSHLSTTPAVSFQTVVAHSPTNHKGKAG
jgi:hypothetical protein